MSTAAGKATQSEFGGHKSSVPAMGADPHAREGASSRAAAPTTTTAHPDFKPVREMEVRLAPELFTFKSPGDLLEGLLVSVEATKIRDKQTQRMVDKVEFMFRAEGKSFKVLGTYDIMQKLTRDDIGKWVEICFKGVNPEVTRNGNAMHVYDIRVERRAGSSGADFGDGRVITDADIPPNF